MTLNKDKSILQLLEHIGLERRGWTVRDFWDADLCAIGIVSESSQSRLVYISTFMKPDGRFHFECEQYLETYDELDCEIADEGEDVGLSELIAAMERHLDTDT
jgi:hypothetical protein